MNAKYWLFIIMLLPLLVFPSRTEAILELEDEEKIADLLPSTFPGFFERDDPANRVWGVLPQVGYGPETGMVGGVKGIHRNIGEQGIVGDVNMTYGANKQQAYTFSLAMPNLMNDHLIFLLRLRYRLDPTREFFGVGNNDIDSADITEYGYEDIAGALMLGWRPFRRVAFNFGLGVRHLDTWCEEGESNGCTLAEFPYLPGINGGLVNYFKFSIVWNNRDDIFRPTKGWRMIFKIIHTNKAFLSDYTFTRIATDAGYLRSFFSERVVFGLRLNFQWVTGPEKEIPFWELTQLGGSDSLRGYYPHRFLGKGQLLLNGECRFLLMEFPFFDISYIRVDGALFGDGGRVFISQDEIQEEFELDRDFIGRVFEVPRYSYGFGLRLVISRSFLARIDVGFSEEEDGLVYMSFGHTF